MLLSGAGSLLLLPLVPTSQEFTPHRELPPSSRPCRSISRKQLQLRPANPAAPRAPPVAPSESGSGGEEDSHGNRPHLGRLTRWPVISDLSLPMAGCTSGSQLAPASRPTNAAAPGSGHTPDRPATEWGPLQPVTPACPSAGRWSPSPAHLSLLGLPSLTHTEVCTQPLMVTCTVTVHTQ